MELRHTQVTVCMYVCIRACVRACVRVGGGEKEKAVHYPRLKLIGMNQHLMY